MNQALVTPKFLHQFDLELTPLPELYSPPPLQPQPPRIGLHCHWNQAFLKGQPLRLRVPSITLDATADTLVIACSGNKQNYQLALVFTDEEQAFRFRMVEQLCHIHHYHQQLQQQGRQLNLNEAACEWINRFASHFTSAVAYI